MSPKRAASDVSADLRAKARRIEMQADIQTVISVMRDQPGCVKILKQTLVDHEYMADSPGAPARRSSLTPKVEKMKKSTGAQRETAANEASGSDDGEDDDDAEMDDETIQRVRSAAQNYRSTTPPRKPWPKGTGAKR